MLRRYPVNFEFQKLVKRNFIGKKKLSFDVFGNFVLTNKFLFGEGEELENLSSSSNPYQTTQTIQTRGRFLPLFMRAY